jgi:hypothetical protein
MIWVDEVVAVTTTGGECRVLLNRDALYMDSDGVRQSAMIEWIAQSFGYVRAVQNIFGLIPQNEPPSRTLLIAVRDGVFHSPLNEFDLDKEKVLHFKVSNIKDMSPLLLFDGMVSSQEGRCLFSARITAYSD